MQATRWKPCVTVMECHEEHAREATTILPSLSNEGINQRLM
jgi:hypothetical protein